MPKKSTRLITVDDTVYRRRVSRRPANNNRSPLTFAVERAEEPGTGRTAGLGSRQTLLLIVITAGGDHDGVVVDAIDEPLF